MNAMLKPEELDLETEEEVQKPDWVLTKLKPKHQAVCSLLAQGFKNVEIAKMLDITPQYVSMLLRQEVIKREIARLCDIAGTRLEALFVQSVEVIASTMENGNAKEKIAAARLQLEATKRIGRPDPNAGQVAPIEDRLAKLAERLIDLQSQAQHQARKRFDNEDAETVPYIEIPVERNVLEGFFKVETDSQGKGN